MREFMSTKAAKVAASTYAGSFASLENFDAKQEQHTGQFDPPGAAEKLMDLAPIERKGRDSALNACKGRGR